ncbi:hypothetical protein BHQ16_08145 [Mycobacterium shimoidei]|nr:hypothetical protein BHQ16_08145 [Mycobacterium shimoidei]
MPPPRRSRTKRLAVAGLIVGSLVVGGAAGVAATKLTRPAPPSDTTVSNTVALQRWWSESQDDFIAVQNASEDVHAAFTRFRPGALGAACQQVHDTAEVKLRAHLPTPNAELTAELNAAIEDYHSAAHMCLAVVAGSAVDYDGEFFSSMAQANMHMIAARKIISEALTNV